GPRSPGGARPTTPPGGGPPPPPGPPPFEPAPPPQGELSMPRLIRAEALRLASTRTYWLLAAKLITLAAAGLPFGLAATGIATAITLSAQACPRPAAAEAR